MIRRTRKPDAASRKAFVEQVMRERDTRAQGYREQALALFPHVCGLCGREFSGRNLQELTVHHKDNNHFNNPPDGSNWELLCIYCHDQVHQTDERRDLNTGSGLGGSHSLGYNAFEGLKLDLPPENETAR
jgi:5-methylcytosine-specific restriction endonuclease McrA